MLEKYNDIIKEVVAIINEAILVLKQFIAGFKKEITFPTTSETEVTE